MESIWTPELVGHLRALWNAKNEAAWGHDMGIDVLALALEFAAKSPDKAIRDAAKNYSAQLAQPQSAPAL